MVLLAQAQHKAKLYVGKNVEYSFIYLTGEAEPLVESLSAFCHW